MALDVRPPFADHSGVPFVEYTTRLPSVWSLVYAPGLPKVPVAHNTLLLASLMTRLPSLCMNTEEGKLGLVVPDAHTVCNDVLCSTKLPSDCSTSSYLASHESTTGFTNGSPVPEAILPHTAFCGVPFGIEVKPFELRPTPPPLTSKPACTEVTYQLGSRHWLLLGVAPLHAPSGALVPVPV